MIWFWLRRLLPIIAIVGMVTAPLAAPACAGAMAAETVTASSDTVASRDMPCCPHEMPAMPDCHKTCLLMALCSAKYFSNGSMAISILPLPVVVAKLLGPRDEAQLASLALSPPIRPPRS